MAMMVAMELHPPAEISLSTETGTAFPMADMLFLRMDMLCLMVATHSQSMGNYP